MPKNAFFGLFFQNFACGAENVAKTGFFSAFFGGGGGARKINLVNLRKRSTKFSRSAPVRNFYVFLIFFGLKDFCYGISGFVTAWMIISDCFVLAVCVSKLALFILID